MARTFNLGDLFDVVVDAVPERTAIIWDDVHLSYRALGERSDRLAAALARRGLQRGNTLGLLMYNSPAFLEALLACFKLGVIPFNINYRYGPDELHHVMNDAGTDALMHDAEFEPVVAQVLARMPPLRLRIVIAEGDAPVAVDTLPYRQAVAEPVGEVDLLGGRSDDDRVLLYTGGTTGLPKGVEWRHHAKFFGAFRGGIIAPTDRPIETPEQLGPRVAGGPPVKVMTLAPLMHGAAMWAALIGLLCGQTVVLLQSHRFDAELVWALVERERAYLISFTSDAMGKPLVDALEANPGRWDLSSLMAITWGGAPLSQFLQDAFRKHFPSAYQLSGMGSSESGAIGMGDTNTGGDGFMRLPGRPDLAVIVDGARFAQPGELGILARTGFIPEGYWRDAKRTAETFISLGERRWVLTGDQARLDADGGMTLFGRGSTCINSGGEKIFAEEVESVIRSHPDVYDAVVIGVPDPRWGQAVTAIAALRPGRQLSLEQLQTYCAGQLARYKLPRRLILQDEVKRSPAGKADYRWATAVAGH